MITIETEIRDSKAILVFKKVNAYLSKISRHYFHDRHILGKDLSKLKSHYIKRFLISGRHFNSIRSQVDGLVASKTDILERQIDTLKVRIKNTEKSIEKKKKRNVKISKVLAAIKCHKTKIEKWKQSNKSKQKPKQIKSILKQDSVLLLKERESNLQVIHQKNRKKSILENTLSHLEKQKSGGKPSICFGSRRLFNKQHHLRQNRFKSHEHWQQEWRDHRDSESYWLGTWSESFRNLNAQYDPWKKQISFRLPDAFVEEFGPKLDVQISDFLYRHEELVDTILNQRQVLDKKTGKMKDRHMPVSYRLKFKGTGGDRKLYLQASFVPRSRAPEYGDKSLGAIGIDLNADHIAWAETDRFGNPINKGSLAFDPHGSSNLVSAQFGDHIASLVAYAKEKDKPIVCERLDFAKKKQALKETEPSRKLRKVLSEFRYKKFLQMLQSRAGRESLKLRSVSASYSSIIGFAKFHAYKSYSTHELAALALARRYLRFSERPRIHGTLLGTASIPTSGEGTKIRHVWSIWSKAKLKIYEQLRLNLSQGISSGFTYSPLHPTGYQAIWANQLEYGSS